MRYKPIVQIDLDGVLNEYNGDYVENFIPPIKKGAKDFLKKLYSEYKLVLFTARNAKIAEKWLIDNGIDNYFEEVNNTKKHAYLTIDDRCICFNGNYDILLENIQNFKVWYKC
mgnify:CR=1 FL=1